MLHKFINDSGDTNMGQQEAKRVMVMAPASVTSNWECEVHKWLPNGQLKITVLDRFVHGMPYHADSRCSLRT